VPPEKVGVPVARPTAKKPSDVTGIVDATVPGVRVPPTDAYAPVCVADWPNALPVELSSVTRTELLTKFAPPAVIWAFQ